MINYSLGTEKRRKTQKVQIKIGHPLDMITENSVLLSLLTMNNIL